MGLRALNAYLEALAAPLAKALDLPHLAPNFPLLTYSALGFTAIHVGIAPVLSKWLAPESYAKLKGRRARNNWCVRALFALPLCARTARVPPACGRLTFSAAYGAQV